MQVLGTVIAVGVDVDVKKQAGGTYKGWELVYKSDGGEVRTIAKPIQGLKFNKALEAALNNLVAGDQFTLEQEKNAQGFYDVKTITKGWVAGGTPTAPAAQKVEGAKQVAYQASTYPTADERSKTQTYIVRQSSLAQAVATLAVGSKGLDKKAVLDLAEDYVQFVLETPKVTGGASTDYDNEIPH